MGDVPEPYLAKLDSEISLPSLYCDTWIRGRVRRHWKDYPRADSLAGRFHFELLRAFLADPEIAQHTLPLPTWADFYTAVEAYGHGAASNEGFLEAKDVIPGRLYNHFTEMAGSELGKRPA